MATIGTFKKSGNDYTGDIVTLSVQAKGVRITAQDKNGNDNAPSHRVFVGKAEIGAAWTKRSNEGRDYLALKLDDPASPPRSTPTSSTTRARTPSASSGRARTADAATEASDAPPGPFRAGLSQQAGSNAPAIVVPVNGSSDLDYLGAACRP